MALCACSYVSDLGAPGGAGAVGQACSWVTPGCETLGWLKGGESEEPGPWSMVYSLLSACVPFTSILKNKTLCSCVGEKKRALSVVPIDEGFLQVE